MKCRIHHIKLLLYLHLSLISIYGYAQPTDDNPGDPSFGIFVAQPMNFGAFTVGAGGGTVMIANNGVRTAAGNIVLLNYGISFLQAIFEIEAPVGTIVTVVNGPTAVLTGSNGGTITLSLGSASPASPFSTTAMPPARTQVQVGGTLTVNNATTPGTYSGTFSVSFHYQ